MKLRTDLLKYATPAEALKEVLANNHRYKSEPLFSRTGTGSLSSASIAERAKEVERSTGTNSESIAAISSEWRGRHIQTVTLADSLDYLRHCHRRAPFLFFNGNTFADIGRTFSDYLFAEMPTGRRREATSAIAHYIAGVLDRESMIEIVESLCETAHWNTGDRIKTLRGSTRGKILRLLGDNRVVWQPDGSDAELIALPESLVRE